MATYKQGSLHCNDQEVASAATVKTLNASSFTDGLVKGDIIEIGALPDKSLLKSITVLVNEKFDGTAPAFDLGFVADSGEVVPFATGIVLTKPIANIVIPMPVTGLDNPDGSAYTGENGTLWSGDDGVEIAIKWQGGATSPTKGNLLVIMDYVYYDTKTGNYGQNKVPLTVYENQEELK